MSGYVEQIIFQLLWGFGKFIRGSQRQLSQVHQGGREPSRRICFAKLLLSSARNLGESISSCWLTVRTT